MSSIPTLQFSLRWRAPSRQSFQLLSQLAITHSGTYISNGPDQTDHQARKPVLPPTSFPHIRSRFFLAMPHSLSPSSPGLFNTEFRTMTQFLLLPASYSALSRCGRISDSNPCMMPIFGVCGQKVNSDVDSPLPREHLKRVPRDGLGSAQTVISNRSLAVGTSFELFRAQIHAPRTIPSFWTTHPSIGNRVKITDSSDQGRPGCQKPWLNPGRNR